MVVIVDNFEKVRSWGRDKSLTNAFKQFDKLKEEIDELKQGMLNADAENIKEEIGDVLVVTIILADVLGLRAEDCLQEAYNKIEKRKGKTIDGTFIKEEDR